MPAFELYCILPCLAEILITSAASSIDSIPTSFKDARSIIDRSRFGLGSIDHTDRRITLEDTICLNRRESLNRTRERAIVDLNARIVTRKDDLQFLDK